MRRLFLNGSIRVPRPFMNCWHCRGEGNLECDDCGGNGTITTKSTKCNGEGTILNDEFVKCQACDGEGEVETECEECGGDGTVECETCRGTGKMAGSSE